MADSNVNMSSPCKSIALWIFSFDWPIAISGYFTSPPQNGHAQVLSPFTLTTSVCYDSIFLVISLICCSFALNGTLYPSFLNCNWFPFTVQNFSTYFDDQKFSQLMRFSGGTYSSPKTSSFASLSTESGTVMVSLLMFCII